MRQHLSFTNLVYALALIATIIGFSAFSQQKEDKSSFRKEQPGTSSTPGKREKPDFDRDMMKLDEAMKKLDVDMKKLNIELQNLNIEETIQQALKEVDFEKINKEIEQAMRNVELTNVTLTKIDRAQIQAELEKAKADMKGSKIDIEKIKVDIDKDKIKAEVEDAMREAREEMLKAKEELKNMKEFTGALEIDKLIDRSKGYKIQVKGGELYLNGKKQTKEVSDKYRRFYKKGDFTIDMRDEDKHI